MSELTKVRALSAGKLSGNLAGSPHEQNSMTENSETLEKGHFPSKKQKGKLHVGNFWEEAKQTPSSDTAVFHVHSRQHANNSCINSPVLQTSHTKHCMLARDDKNFAEESTPLSACYFWTLGILLQIFTDQKNSTGKWCTSSPVSYLNQASAYGHYCTQATGTSHSLTQGLDGPPPDLLCCFQNCCFQK